MGRASEQRAAVWPLGPIALELAVGLALPSLYACLQCLLVYVKQAHDANTLRL